MYMRCNICRNGAEQCAGCADFDRRFPNWERDAETYAREMAALKPEQKQHALCDHAYGICQG